MGRRSSQQRQPQQSEQSTPDRQDTSVSGSIEGEIAVALLTGAGVGAVSPPLLLVMPPGLLSLPDVAAEVAEQVARFILSVPLNIPETLPGAGIVREAALNAAVYRAAYALAATRRAAAAVLGRGGGVSAADALGAFLRRERRNLEAHRDATRRRMSAAKTTEGMMELHGPVLNWRHGQTRTPDEPRPHHLAANGKNYDLRRGIPVSTGALPGVERWCSCAWGPPVAGAPMMI